MDAPPTDILIAGFAATVNLFRVCLDFILEAYERDDEASGSKGSKRSHGRGMEKGKSAYGSVKAKDSGSVSVVSGNATTITEATSLISGADVESAKEDPEESKEPQSSGFVEKLPKLSLLVHCLLLLFFSLHRFLSKSSLLQNVALTVLAGLVFNLRDSKRERFSFTNRVLYVSSAVILFVAGTLMKSVSGMIAIIIYCVLAVTESWLYPYPKKEMKTKKKATLSRESIIILLKPYFWPDATTNSALLNRVLVILTWVCVLGSKGSNLVAPVMLGKASTALAKFNYGEAIQNSIYYVILSFFSKLFKEGQSLLYLKVAQAAFIQLSEKTFHHIHTLSLDWHLKKKLGDVIRSMDRGISACDTLMKYLFLWLVPAIGECVVVCIIFASYFKYFPLSIAVFFFVLVYMVLTIVLTLWRKKFRKAVAKSDNAWHDRCTDSLINFETVKYFTGENYEKEKFKEAISTYQVGSVNVAASLSILNISQQVLYQACLGTALGLAVMGIKERFNCCVSQGCDLRDLDCCSDIGQNVCPGMEMGDFVAVLTYTINLFAPLNFLGTVYNAVVMAVVDLTNLLELLAEEADVVDRSDAINLPKTNDMDEDTAVEFDNVFFNYPTQPENSGLKGLSFKMKRGTVTAVVGPTGAGKTTVSRLFFRFYDVLHGAVKINGVNVRNITQKSLRSSIGVVPQTATMFNDTIRTNVLYGKRDGTQEDLDQAMRDAQLEDFISSLPLGWETMVGDRGLKLSGGEKQRAAIARCLLKNPPFVVLDEATSALDTITENSIQEALDRLGKDRTVLVIAHRLGTIRNADNIVVLDDGVVAEQGTHEELLELDGKYAAMWNMQLHQSGSGSSLSQLNFDTNLN